MAYTEKWQTNPTAGAAINFTFPYIKESDVKVELNGALLSNSGTTKYSQATTSITLLASYFTGGNALVSSDIVRVYRDTDVDASVSTFYPGSAIRSGDLNDNFTQSLYTAQESEESAEDALRATNAFIATTADEGTTWTLKGNNTNSSTDPKGVGYAVTTSEAANTKSDAAVLTANAADVIADDAADDVKRWIKDGDGTDTAGNEDDADFTARPLKPQGVPYAVAQATAAVSSAASANTTAASAVVSASTANTVAAAAVVTANAAFQRDGTTTMTGGIAFEGASNDNHETTLTVVDPTADRTITLPNETGTVITSAGTNVIDSDHYVDGSIDNVHMSVNSVDSDQYVDGSIDGVHIANDAIDSQHYAAGSIDNEHIADGAIDSAALSDATVITNSEQASATANDTSFLTSSASDARYFLQNSTETLKDGVSWASTDAYIATAAAIDDRVASLVNEVGGFVAIANEGSFPTTNPDINDNTGTVVSITSLSADRTASGSGVLTTGFTTTGSVAVTITGCTNNQVYKQGYGLQVETTSTLNTYTFVRYVPQTSDVITIAAAATNINTVAGIASHVTTVAGISGNVTTVAGNNANITTCATNISNINSASGHATTATTKATEAASSATAAATSATAAASSTTAAATSATSAAGAVTALNTLSYYKNLGSIADSAGTTSDYGAIA
jgi:hypothetical protein